MGVSISEYNILNYDKEGLYHTRRKLMTFVDYSKVVEYIANASNEIIYYTD